MHWCVPDRYQPGSKMDQGWVVIVIIIMTDMRPLIKIKEERRQPSKCILESRFAMYVNVPWGAAAF
jgi:hypothetical protein